MVTLGNKNASDKLYCLLKMVSLLVKTAPQTAPASF